MGSIASESNANEFAWSMRTMNCFACDGRQIADVETGWRERSMMCCAAELVVPVRTSCR